MKTQLLKQGSGALGIALLLAVWMLLTARGLVAPTLLPSPAVVAETAYAMLLDGTLLTDIAASLQRVLCGFALGFALALPIGALMGIWEWARRVVDPVIDLFRPVPPFAMIPLGILWFGIGEWSKVLIIAYAAFFPITANVMSGLRQVEALHLKAVLSLGATRLQAFRYVTLRSAVPHLFLGIRAGLSMAFISLIAAELIASDNGLGFLIQEGRSLFRTEQVLVGMIAIGIIGACINRGLAGLERYWIRWK